MIGAVHPHDRLDVDPVGGDRRVAGRGDVRDVGLVDGDADTDAHGPGLGRCAVAGRARVRVRHRLERHQAGRGDVGGVGEVGLRDRRDDVDRGGAGDGDCVAAAARALAGPVAVGGRRLGAARVGRLRALAAVVARRGVCVLDLVVGLAVDVLARAVGRSSCAVLAVRAGCARVGLGDDGGRAVRGERDRGGRADLPRDRRGDLVVRRRRARARGRWTTLPPAALALAVVVVDVFCVARQRHGARGRRASCVPLPSIVAVVRTVGRRSRRRRERERRARCAVAPASAYVVIVSVSRRA